MKLLDKFWIAILFKALDYITSHAYARVYTSPVPVGRKIGGKDIPEVADLYVIIDVRFSGRIIVLGYFQTT